ncbi:hypothetical protein, partial [Pseudomonas aeruginosa]|uniref:hypothetical protein n=1 Tax=Pseudomonas aeruginosa TaxID=287 RepID=UPI00280EF14A
RCCRVLNGLCSSKHGGGVAEYSMVFVHLNMEEVLQSTQWSLSRGENRSREARSQAGGEACGETGGQARGENRSREARSQAGGEITARGYPP